VTPLQFDGVRLAKVHPWLRTLINPTKNINALTAKNPVHHINVQNKYFL